jgi:hypothetical protein
VFNVFVKLLAIDFTPKWWFNIMKTIGNYHRKRRSNMKKLSTKKLQVVHNAISDYDHKNKNIIFDIPSMMKYCIENDVRMLLEEKKLDTNEIYSILNAIDFDVYFKQLKANNNLVKIRLNYNDFDSFANYYMSTI